MKLDPDQMAALMEQMTKKKGNNQFASVKAGLWLTRNKPDIIKYYIDPQICKTIQYIIISFTVRNKEFNKRFIGLRWSTINRLLDSMFGEKYFCSKRLNLKMYW